MKVRLLRSRGAALGLLGAWGIEIRMGDVQFLKRESSRSGELLALEWMEAELTLMGDGFTWSGRDLGEAHAKAVHGWGCGQKRLASGAYNVFLFDEFTYVMNYSCLYATAFVA